MPSRLLTATLQSAVIALLSCLVAHLIRPEEPPHYLSLVIYSLISTPPNFWWQKTLERHFPGYDVSKVEIDDGGKGVEVEKKLNVKNTIVKILLDQTVAAVPNTVGYIGITRLLRGLPFDMCWNAVKEQTLPVMMAGYKLWPAVNVVQHVFVPVDQRVLLGNVVGMAWGVYMALTAAR